MSITPTYPGVYIEEVPSGVRPITGVATSIAAFVGNFTRGPTDEVVRLFSVTDFQREFGGLRADSLASYAIAQFFLNGGGQAWVARVSGGATATVGMGDAADALVATAHARNPGLWGNNLRVEVDYGTNDPATSFNLTVTEVVNGEIARTESFRNLTVTPADSRYAIDVVNEESKLISLVANAGSTTLPAATGTVSAPFTSIPALNLADPLTVDAFGAAQAAVNLTVLPSTMAQLAAELQSVIRAADPLFAAVTVTVVGSLATGASLRVTGGGQNPDEIVVLGGALGTALGFNAARQNVQWYALGSASSAGKQQGGGVAGTDGNLPDAAALIGALGRFDPVDLVNILCVPDTDQLADTDAAAVIAAATAYAHGRRAFYIVDPPNADVTRDELPEIEAWLDANGTLRHENAAAYWPRPRIPDPLNEFRLRPVPASGTVAGVYARIDAQRGVWKAPAGLEANLRGVQQLELVLSDAQNGVLNPVGLNCLRFFRTAGNVVWGARTLVGSDQLASQWKYVPVRRLALFLEESLYRGTQFAVFEPNDEPLWAQIRLNVGAFMQGLFLQGAFQGVTPRQAYLVKCDAETTTQDDINHGIVNILVGFAPLKPAEFVIIRISQLAGQTQA
jgi:phage tail sheath protein FI